MPPKANRAEVLSLYKKILRSAQTFPSRRQAQIYEAIREEFRDNITLDEDDPIKYQQQLVVAYRGLDQLRQFDVSNMTSGNPNSASWEVQMERNPMPKPVDYEERTKKKK